LRYLILALTLSASSAFASVNVADYIAPCDPYPQDACFQAAVDAANGEPVHVPTGNYWLTAPTSSAAWIVDANVSLYNPAPYPTGNTNLSYLTGIVSQIDHDTETGLIVGSMNFQPYVDVRPSAIPHAMINGVSPFGTGAISAYTRTGAKSSASEGTIGVTTYVLNDNEASPGVAYGEYTEVIKWPNAGATFGDESNLTCYGSLERILPSGVYGNTSQICSNYWIGGPVGSGPLNGQYSKSPTSAGITFAGGTAKWPDGKNLGFDAGVVFTRKAFESSTANEIIRTFTGSQIIWHGSGFNPKGAIGVWETEKGGEVWIKAWGTRGKVTYKFTEDGLILPSGKILN
jgi:hypothetical protein